MRNEELAMNNEQVINNKGRRIIFCALLAVICYLLFGCANPFEPPRQSAPLEAEYGRVSINFAGGRERTVLPAKVFDNYIYTFTKGSDTPFTLDPDTDDLFTLEVGEWRVDVKAYVGEIIPANLAATGTADFTVSPGPDAAEVTVDLDAAETEDGFGTFTYTVKYPADTDIEITLKKLPGLTPDVDLITNSDTVTNGDSKVITGTAEDVPAGFYLLTVQISKGGLHAGINEAVHIYPLLTTTYTAEFDEDDLLPTVVNIANIEGLTAIVGQQPVTAITPTDHDQYTVAVAWSPNDAAFVVGTQYTATITLTAESGYTLQGVPANFFTVAGADSFISNAAGLGVITAVFTPRMVVKTTEEWNAAKATIRTGGNNKRYIIEVDGNVSVAGYESISGDISTMGLGSVTGITVTLTGNGKLYLALQNEVTNTDRGSILVVSTNQTLIIDSADLTLQGLKEGQDGATRNNNAATVYVEGTNARLELKNGTISGNANSDIGGGVYLSVGSFTMTGGTITGNSARDGGGVYTTDPNNNVRFTMTGGTITGNTATTNGGGLYQDNSSSIYRGGIFTVGGTAQIYGNTVDALPNNVYISNGRYIALGSGADAPVSGMNINVRTATASGVIVNSGASAGVEPYFHADQDGKTVVLSGERLVIADYVGSIVAPNWRQGNPASPPAAPTVINPAGQSKTTDGWEISNDGSSGWTELNPLETADNFDGKYLRYYATFSGGQTYCSNIVEIQVLASNEYAIIIAMWDNEGAGWYSNTALRINVNGSYLTTDARLESGGGPGYYTFIVETDDDVKLYWQSGTMTTDRRCAYAVYYSDDPPNPAFDPTENAAVDATKLLDHLQYRTGGTLGDNTTLRASFTIGPPVTVSYDLNGGAGTTPPPQTVYTGIKVTLPLGNGLSKTDHSFGGWNTASDGLGTNYNAGSPYEATETITLFAKWNPITIVTNTTQWENALAEIRDGGPNKSYLIEISGDIGVGGVTVTNATTGLGSVTGITVTLIGDGKLYLTGQGSILRVNANQTLIIDSAGLTLQGYNGNNNSTVYVYGSNAKFQLDNGEISGNTVTGAYAYGGVYVNGAGSNFTMNGGTISNNSMNTTSGSRGGGGVSVIGGSFTMNEGIISGNDVTSTGQNGGGGGVYVTGNGGSFTMKGGIIRDNTVNVTGTYPERGGGGGVYVLYSSESGSTTFTMDGGIICDNEANGTSNKGGGVYVTGANSIFTMKDATISNNISDSYGGGVHFESSTVFAMTNAIISGNTTGNYGGGVSISGTTAGSSAGFNMDATSTISGNTVNVTSTGSNYGGGGVYFTLATNITSGTFICEGTISDNHANGSYGSGGGVFITSQSNNSFTMSAGAITNNTAGGKGGGVYIAGYINLTIDGATVSGNTVTNNGTAYSGGGGVYVSSSYGSFTMSGGTISDNIVNITGGSQFDTSGGGGVYVYPNCTFYMTGGTISGNKTTDTNTNHGGGGVFVNNQVGNALTIFEKTGGTIYGDNEPIVADRNTANSNRGHAVYLRYGSYRYYRNETLDTTDDINSNDTLPTTSGQTVGNWTRQ